MKKQMKRAASKPFALKGAGVIDGTRGMGHVFNAINESGSVKFMDASSSGRFFEGGSNFESIVNGIGK